MFWTPRSNQTFKEAIDDALVRINSEKGDCQYIVITTMTGDRKGFKMSYPQVEVHWFYSHHSRNDPLFIDFDTGEIEIGEDKYIYRYSNEEINVKEENGKKVYSYTLDNLFINGNPIVRSTSTSLLQE